MSNEQSSRDWGQSQVNPTQDYMEKERLTRSPKEQTLVTESGDKIHLPCYMTGFLMDVERMNGMYRMPEVVDYIDPMLLRLKEFRSILGEEVQEIDDIDWDTTSTTKAAMDVRIQFADLLGDIIVYCASEAKRWGIPIDRVLNIIMQSNFSKLDSNGQPIYDERMKLQKGPNYWKPEPKIAALLKGEE